MERKTTKARNNSENHYPNAEKNFLKIYEHFKLIAGQGLMPKQIRAVEDRFLSPPDVKRKQDLMESLLDKGYIQEDLKLTPKGEEYFYGVFNIEEGLLEFMEIFRHYKRKAGAMVNIGHINTFKDKLSPLTKKHFEEIIEHSIQKGYTKKGEGRLPVLFLTGEGEKTVYPE